MNVHYKNYSCSGISVFTGESAKRQVNPRAALTTKICVSIVVVKGYKG
jgi:hypothetical protein